MTYTEWYVLSAHFWILYFATAHPKRLLSLVSSNHTEASPGWEPPREFLLHIDQLVLSDAVNSIDCMDTICVSICRRQSIGSIACIICFILYNIIHILGMCILGKIKIVISCKTKCLSVTVSKAYSPPLPITADEMGRYFGFWENNRAWYCICSHCVHLLELFMPDCLTWTACAGQLATSFQECCHITILCFWMVTKVLWYADNTSTTQHYDQPWEVASILWTVHVDTNKRIGNTIQYLLNT